MKAPIVIATLLQENDHNGVQAHFSAFNEYLRNHGESAQIITPFHVSHALVYPIFGVRRLIHSLNGAASVWWYRYWHYLFLRYALGRFLKSGMPAIIYAQCPLSAKAALKARRSASQRIIMIAHFNLSQANEWAEKGMISADGNMYRAIQNTERKVLPAVDGIVYVSQFSKQNLEQWVNNLGNTPSAVIPNFVAEPETIAVNGPLADIINIGTMEPRKNQRYLIDVLIHASQMGHRYTLTLIGDGPDREALERLVRENELEGQVNFMGAVPDAARYIRHHRLYAHSATMESFGIVLIEAMASSIPVIAAPVGGIPEVFSEGCEGIFWPLDNPKEGARRLCDLLERPDHIKQKAAAARQRYLGNFTAEIAAGRLYEFLLHIASLKNAAL